MSAKPTPFGAETKVILEVGERRFTTFVQTLTKESGFFAALLLCKRENMGPECPYFIDLNGDVFAHVLQYLRSGVLPVFYDNSKGHDHNFYAMVLGQASYLQIPRLEQWLKEKTYLQAVTVTCSIKEVPLQDSLTETTFMDGDVEFRSQVRIKKVFLCPRRIPEHRGHPDRCGRRCDDAMYDYDDIDEFENEEYVVVSVIRTKIEVNQELCMRGATVGHGTPG